MRSASLVVFALFCSVLGGTCADAQVRETRPNPALVVIRVGQPDAQATRVPATLFGSFLEPIGNSLDKGLSAELLKNGSLEDGMWSYVNIQKLIAEQPEIATSNNETGVPYPWVALHPKAGRRYELHHGSAANSWQSVELMGFPGPPVGIAQRTYLPVQRTLVYRASLYARHLTGDPKITVSLRRKDSEDVLAQATMEATAAGWTRYGATLTLKAGDVKPMEAIDFAVSVERDERIDLDEISLEPSDAVEGLDPDVLAMAQAMKSVDVRFGGNFSSAYHWRDGVGDPDKRLSQQNIAWGIPEYNKFGTDEFLAFCKRLHAVPQIDLNMGSGTPEEAADWVRYIRAHYPEKVVYELGNELYGNWQVGHLNADQIAERTIAFSKAVRAADPNAELIATGGMPEQFEHWNAAQLTTPPSTFDLLSTHLIRITNQVRLPNPTPDFIAAAAYGIPVELGRDLEKMQQQLDEVPALSGHVHFALDEWLFNSRGKGDRVFTNESPSSKNEGGGLMVASVFNTLVRHSNIVPVSEITGLMEFAGIWKDREQVYGTPPYYVFQLYTTIQGDTILPVATDTGTYTVDGGVEGFTHVADIPYVDAIASLTPDRKHLTVFCINRDLTRDLAVQLDLADFKPATTAAIERLSSSNRYEVNDATHPRNVVPQASQMDVASRGPVTLTLPHESLTMIRFEARQ